METILEKLKLGKKIENEEYTSLLNKCGFPKINTNYPIITLKAIEQYLKSLIPLNYEITHEFSPINRTGDHSPRDIGYGFRIVYVLKTSIFSKRSFDRKQISWKEHKIEEFKCTPPLHVLTSIREATDKFDALRIVTINIEDIKDPLVVGINKNNSDRYLIDWWDEDIEIVKINLK